MSFVEADDDATARALASQHSARCHLYKLGAYWGYSGAVLRLFPSEPANYALEIQHHATRAGLPERLFSPMTAPSDGLPARDTSSEVTRALVARANVAAPSEREWRML